MADNLKVNFTDEESSSETRSFVPVAPGFYPCAITKVEDASVATNEKGNFGKPFWRITLVVQEGPHARRNFWTNVMLFEGALHTASQLLKAVGMGDLVKKGAIPDGQSLVGKKVDVNISRTHNKKEEEDLRSLGENTAVYKNEVKGFRAPQAAKSGGNSSLLPQ